ncbi:MAG: 2-amino-4-hydroxy-6-hydroxymethyldihydropteridine diphosphokinase [Wenzhouxiangella sp.]
MTRAWISLGGNLGDPRASMEAALADLDELESTRVAAVSPAYRTAPWGVTDQPDFLNAVAELETALTPQALLAALLDIESRLGRRRDAGRWGPRRIDLDLLVYDDCVIDEPDLKLPHPHLPERAFVLVPLNDLAPELVVPGIGRVDESLAALDDKQIESVKRAQPLAWPPDRRPQQS